MPKGSFPSGQEPVRLSWLVRRAEHSALRVAQHLQASKAFAAHIGLGGALLAAARDGQAASASEALAGTAAEDLRAAAAVLSEMGDAAGASELAAHAAAILCAPLTPESALDARATLGRIRSLLAGSGVGSSLAPPSEDTSEADARSPESAANVDLPWKDVLKALGPLLELDSPDALRMAVTRGKRWAPLLRPLRTNRSPTTVALVRHRLERALRGRCATR